MEIIARDAVDYRVNVTGPFLVTVYRLSRGGTRENGVYLLAMCWCVMPYDCYTKGEETSHQH